MIRAVIALLTALMLQGSAATQAHAGPPRGQAARTRRAPGSWSRRDRVAEPLDQLHFELDRTNA